MKTKLFVVSDIHGFYTPFRKALEESGFDEHNEAHVLICCGDLFDRGSENKKVYDYIKSLQRKILVRGNHDERLEEILTQKRINVFDVRNGVIETVEEFFGVGSVNACGDLRIAEGEEQVKELCTFVSEMADYYETEHYIFVHGWIPLEYGTQRPLTDWRSADAKAWHKARFTDWLQFYGINDMISDKVIVCGHRPTRLAYSFDSRSLGDSSIYFGDGMIAIDAGTVSSGRVNVLVLEEEL